MPLPDQNTRVLVACSMKSGSTYIAKVLALYFGAERAEPVPYWGRLEQNLHEPLLAEHLDRGFVLQLHLKPHVPNIELIRRLGIAVVWVWRNLGDVVVSFDDHIFQEDHRNPVCYVDNRARYMAMPVQHRYRYLIDQAIPWYLGFYLSWKQIRPELPFIETHYEELACDKFGYFARVIEKLGYPLDELRLREIVGPVMPETRFNRGVNGRSLELLSPANKRRLEDVLLEHLEELLPLWAELPWRGTTAAPASPLLRQLECCDYNRAAGKVTRGREGLRIDVAAEDFYFIVPHRVLAPSPGQTARIRLIVRGDTGTCFSLYWREAGMQFSEQNVLTVPYSPSSEPSMIEFMLGEEFSRRRFQFRLDCFNWIKCPGMGEILDIVKVDS